MANETIRLVNDPGYWGAVSPEVLVLGITKGNTQSNAMKKALHLGEYDTVAFKNFRPRLLDSLKAIGLLEGSKNISSLLTKDEQNFGWASIVRCSLTAKDRVGEFRGTSNLVVKALKTPDGNATLERCIRTFIGTLSRKTRLVILLSNADAYMDLIQKTFSRIFPDFQKHPTLSPVVFRAAGRFFVHTAHPSPLNGEFGKFLSESASGKQGAKREMAKSAVVKILLPIPVVQDGRGRTVGP